MKIVENDTTIEVEDGSLVEDVFDIDKVVLIDGYAVARDYALSDGESVTSIEKGVMPSLETLKKLITARNTPNMQQ
ncbi:MAG: ThiS-like ubiquitin domain-containing protein, partial [Clostridia bacterium]